MPSVTLKNIPPDLLAGLRARAKRDRRSLNSELLYLLEEVLAEDWPRRREGSVRTPVALGAEEQARAWERLAGRWQSDRSAAEEIADILERRTSGRQVDL